MRSGPADGLRPPFGLPSPHAARPPRVVRPTHALRPHLGRGPPHALQPTHELRPACGLQSPHRPSATRRMSCRPPPEPRELRPSDAAQRRQQPNALRAPGGPRAASALRPPNAQSPPDALRPTVVNVWDRVHPNWARPRRAHWASPRPAAGPWAADTPSTATHNGHTCGRHGGVGGTHEACIDDPRFKQRPKAPLCRAHASQGRAAWSHHRDTMARQAQRNLQRLAFKCLHGRWAGLPPPDGPRPPEKGAATATPYHAAIMHTATLPPRHGLRSHRPRRRPPPHPAAAHRPLRLRQM